MAQAGKVRRQALTKKTWVIPISFAFQLLLLTKISLNLPETKITAERNIIDIVTVW